MHKQPFLARTPHPRPWRGRRSANTLHRVSQMLCRITKTVHKKATKHMQITKKGAHSPYLLVLFAHLHALFPYRSFLFPHLHPLFPYPHHLFPYLHPFFPYLHHLFCYPHPQSINKLTFLHHITPQFCIPTPKF